jgi:mRNA-decapping enzyme subunit 2
MPQTVHNRQKQITNSFSLQSLGTDHDLVAQESSSQSSSADNGGPHTPSPQYSEPVTNHSANGVRVSAHAEDDASKTLMTAVDPNLARLLNSLSMSATVSVDDRNGAKPLLPLQSVRSIPPASTTPAPITASSASPSLPRHSDQADWSSHVPKPLSERPVDTPPASSSSLHGSASIGTRPLPDTTRASSRHHQPPPALSLSPYSNGPGTTCGSHPTPPTPLSAAISTVSISSVTSSPSAARKMSSRRTSSTADISPYLSRPSEIPTSGKRLKQLALLETVADESARMTPQLANRDYLTQPTGPRDSTQGYQLPMNGRHPYASRSPASVPPSYTTNNIDDLRVIYSSGQGPDPMQPGMSYHPQTRPAPPDDPFQVRPRINQTGPMYPGHPFPGRAASMHQNQLLSLLAAPGFQGPNMLTPAQPPPAPQLVGPYPHPILGPPPPPPQAFQHSVSVRAPPPPPLHVMPHNLYPPQGQPPTSTPALSPTFAAAPAPNSNLLSILNGTKSVATGSTHGTNTMAPTSILNGIMHR